MEVWFRFFLSAALIILAGTRLTKSARALAEKTGLGMIWAGALLLPLATSLPELVTSWRAAVIDSPDLAAGNVFGSVLFNLFIIALVDLAQGKGPLLPLVKKGHILTAAFSIILLSVSLLGILFPFMPRIGWVGLDTILLAVIYWWGHTQLMRYEKKKKKADQLRRFRLRDFAPTAAMGNYYRQKAPGRHENREKRQALLKPLLNFLASSALIIWAGANLTDAADTISQLTGLGQTFIGSFLLAVTTSLPELVTTLTAVRLGVLDMAVGNIFGANLFNILILFASDIFYRQGPITSAISPMHAISVLMGIILTSVAIIGLIYPTRRSFLHLGYASLIIMAGYLVAFFLIFTTGLAG